MWQPDGMPLLGLVATPFEWLLGPVVTYNLMVTLALSLSGTAAYVALRRWIGGTAGPVIGGLFYGFSPFVTTQSLGHLNVMFVPIPPLLLLAVTDLLVYRRWRWWQSGIAIGLLGTAQFLIGQEILVGTLLVTAVVVVVVLVCHWERVAARWRSLAGGDPGGRRYGTGHRGPATRRPALRPLPPGREVRADALLHRSGQPGPPGVHGPVPARRGGLLRPVELEPGRGQQLSRGRAPRAQRGGGGPELATDTGEGRGRRRRGDAGPVARTVRPPGRGGPPRLDAVGPAAEVPDAAEHAARPPDGLHGPGRGRAAGRVRATGLRPGPDPVPGAAPPARWPAPGGGGRRPPRRPRPAGPVGQLPDHRLRPALLLPHHRGGRHP